MIKIIKKEIMRINADKFAYDGCHKIYILEDKNDIKKAKEIGYDIYDITELEKIYNNSCPLKFISNWKLNKSYVEQCEDEEKYIEFEI